MAPDAPVLHDDLFTAGVDPKPTKPSNVAKMVRFAKGDVEAGFARSRGRHRAALHDQAGAPGLYRAACLRRLGRRRRADARSGARARASSWSAPILRAICSASTSPTSARSRPRSAAGSAARRSSISSRSPTCCRRRPGRPVKIVMSREEVFRAHRADLRRRHRGQARRQEGRPDRRRRSSCSNTRRAPSRARRCSQGCMCGFAMYDLPNVDVDRLRRRVATARRSPPTARRARRSRLVRGRELPRRAGPRTRHRPAEAARDQRAPRTAPRRRTGRPGPISAIRRRSRPPRRTEHLKTPLGPNQGRGIASGYWHNAGGEFERRRATSTRTARSASTEGHPDIGGSRASMAMMVAEVLGIPFETGAPGRRRHHGDRLQRLDRRQPRHLCRPAWR